MYYPIIVKLKEIMADLTSVKDKEPLIIEGTATSQGGGTWTGNWSDIVSASNANKPVYFSITLVNNKFLIPVVVVGSDRAESGIIYINNMLAYGQISDNNTFYLWPIQ